MTMQEMVCSNRHVSPKKPSMGDTTSVMICRICEDFVEVTANQVCTCCGNNVKRSYESENKDIKTIQKTVAIMMPYLQTWQKIHNKSVQPCVHMPIGIHIRAVRIELLCEFLQIRSQNYDRFLKKLKKESSIVAINCF